MNVLPELRDEVVRAATRQQPAQGELVQRMRRGFGIVPTLISVAVAVAIAVVAVTELRHRASSPPRQVSVAHSIPASVRGLVDELAILRSSEGSSARQWLRGSDFRRLTERPRLFRIVRSLVRTVSLPDHERLTLYVVDSNRPGFTGLGFMERGRSSGEGECCITARELRRPFGPGPLNSQSGRIPPQVYFEIVPDGVHRVRWTFAAAGHFQRIPRRIARRRNRNSPGYIADPNSAPLTVTVTVHNNVAAMKLPNRGAATTDLWLNSAGKVIARHRTH